MSALSRGKFAAGSAAAFASVAIIARPARAAQFTWKWGLDLGPEHPIGVRAVEAFARIRKETNGQLDIKTYANSSLGSISSMLTQVRLGALEMCAMPSAVFDSLVPIASIENVAFAFPNRKAVFGAMDGEVGALIRKASLEKGLYLLEIPFENGWRDFTSSKGPIRTVADLEGLKLRVSPGKIRLDTFHSLGASVTTLPSSELYTGLQTHVVDAMESSLGVIESLHVYEVQKYCSRTHHMWSGYWNLINPEKWNSLPPPLQRSLATHLNQAALLERRDNEVQDPALVDLLHRQGLGFNTPPHESFKAKLIANGYYPRWRAEFGEQAWSALEKYTGRIG